MIDIDAGDRAGLTRAAHHTAKNGLREVVRQGQTIFRIVIIPNIM